ncbi:phosphoribosylglycinamide formyltransferase [Parafilimonas sp.]|uniref:phosphoribosylglycinamide formyltransferase n=1 Tax=Parafilimonas sp. TaxID=1969739 RepID=UPI0039E38BE4
MNTTIKKNIAIFASGAGTNAANIIQYFSGSSAVAIALIVCNNAKADVLKIAADNNIPSLLIEKERFFRGDGYVPELQNAGIDFIVLAGFLWKIPAAIIHAYRNNIINIHPALLPKFGGKGMYGNFVHHAVLSAGEKESGITIHFVDEFYDNGKIIFQTTCPVYKNDTSETLAKRIHALEYKYFPKVIEEVTGRV